MARYRKKPVEVDAVQWTGTNVREVQAFASGDKIQYGDGLLVISTLEGDARASPGDWIIRGIRGEYYPCKPDIFTATYEPVQ